MPLNEFIRRFGLLSDSTTNSKEITVESVLAFNDIEASIYRIGPSQVSPLIIYSPFENFSHKLKLHNFYCGFYNEVTK